MPHAIFEGLAGSERTLVGGWVSIAAEPVFETMFAQGYDYVGIDTQHTLMDAAGAGRLLYSIPRGGPPALVRVASNNAPDIGKVLDAGADGVIVPMVNTAEEARAVVAACRYGPQGVRSFGPIRADLPPDVAGLTARVACFVMIETRTAVDNIEAICAVPGLTGVYVGPVDLAITLGLPVRSDPMPQPLHDALAKVGQACAKAGIIAAGHFPVGQLGLLKGLGFRMFTIGADRGYIARGAAAELKVAREGLS